MLDRPVYSYAEADRLLRLSPGTARRWVDGYRRQGVDYLPVVRERSSGSPWVTWGEFVEARLLSEFRQGIPMLKLRPVVEWLRQHTQTRYPLSYSRPFLLQDGRDLLLRAQNAAGLDESALWMVFPVAGQGALMTATSRRFTEAIHSDERTGGPVFAISADPATPDVLLAPGRRQGQPSVGNVPTAAVAELVAAGEPIDFVADSYEIDDEMVRQAVTYEATRRRAA